MSSKKLKRIISSFLVAAMIMPTLNTFAETTVSNTTENVVVEDGLKEEGTLDKDIVDDKEASLDNNEVTNEVDKPQEDIVEEQPTIENGTEAKDEGVNEDNNTLEEDKIEEKSDESNLITEENKYVVNRIPLARMASEEVYEKEEFNQKAVELNDVYLLETKTDDKYEIALASSDGSYYFVDSTSESIDKAIETANNTPMALSDEDLIPVVIDAEGRTVYATESMARIYKHIDGKPYPYFDVNTNVYLNSSLSGSAYTYINHGYVDDAPIIEDSGTSALIQVSGYKGWINKDTSKSEFDMLVYPLNQVTNPSYYTVKNGVLNHFITTNLISTSGSGNFLQLGPAPSFLQEGVKYYSYDGRYFYTSLSTLLSDLKANSTSKAVNSNSIYYNYYNSLPFRSKTFVSASQIDAFLNANTDSKSKLRGTGQAFIDAQNAYGVNAALMVGVAINESSWGMSSIAQEKNNLFGINAVDSNTSQANVFSSVRECIIEFAKNYISRGYSDPADWRYYGGYLGNKEHGANVKYASDPFWGEKAAQHAYSIDRSASGSGTLLDYNSYQLAVATTSNEVRKADGTLLYNIRSMSSQYTAYPNTPFIVTNENTVSVSGKASYEIYPERDTPVNSGGDANKFSGSYNWDSKGYVATSGVAFINTPSRSTATGVSVTGNLYTTETLTFTASGSPSANTLYKLWVCDRTTGEWIVLSDYSTRNSITYTPMNAGNYSFVVHVKNKNSDRELDDYTSVDVTVKGKSKITNLEIQGSRAVGETLTMVPTALPKNDTLYKYFVKEPGASDWKVLKDYSTATSVDYTPTKSGNYNFIVHVKHKTSTNSTEDGYKSVDIQVGEKSKVTALSVTGNPYAGQKLTMKAEGSPADSTLYKLWVCDRSTGEWTVLSDYSTKNTIDYVPTKAGRYTFTVHVKNKYSVSTTEEDYRSVDVDVKLAQSKVDSATVTGSKLVNDKVTMSATATPAEDTLYKLWICDRTTGEWTVLSDYSTKNTIDYVPTKAGRYTFTVHVKNKYSLNKDEDDYKSIDFEVKSQTSKVTSLDVTGTTMVGSKLTMKASGTPADSTLYKLWVCDRSTGVWTVLSDYSTKNTIDFTPTKGGRYTFTVHVKNKYSLSKDEDDYKSVDVEVTSKTSKVTSLDVTGTTMVGSNLTMKASGTPADETLYKLWVCDRSTGVWTVLSDYSTKNTIDFTPTKAGRYTFTVHVKNKYSGNTDEDDYKSIDVEVTSQTSKVSSFDVTGNATVGSKLTMKASGTPADSTLYKLWVCDRSTGVWTVLSDYSSKNTIDFTPTKAGRYTFTVHVKNKYSANTDEDDYKSIDITVK